VQAVEAGMAVQAVEAGMAVQAVKIVEDAVRQCRQLRQFRKEMQLIQHWERR
jgi:hypothetical protein